jgi:hypothetical protein
MPNMPQPKNDSDALVMIHMARTQMESFNIRLRAYSHCWLTERGFPSQQPDHIRPRAERMYPRVVDAVGVACRGTSEVGRAIAPIVERAMTGAVLEAYADKRTDPVFVKRRMLEARSQVVRKLIGR